MLNRLLNLVPFFFITVKFLVCVFAISIFFLGLSVPPDIDKVSFFADSAYSLLVNRMGYEVEPDDDDGVYDI